MSTPLPKIELHVHLEGAIRPPTLLSIAQRNGLELPVNSPEELEALYAFKDFEHFVEVWVLTTNCLATAEDFSEIVVSYAAEAASYDGIYLEAIFSPAERVKRGVSYDALFNGYCEGAVRAKEEHGVTVAFTPDIYRGASLEEACEVARWSVAFKDRGVVGLGLGGLEAQYPPGPYAPAFAIGRDGGLGSVPHAGEAAGPESIRAALRSLHADRIRHGIRAIEDDELVAELVEREIVLDVCPTSNLRTGVVAGLDEHPLGRLIEAGVLCSVSTDDPAMFGTDLGREHELALDLGLSSREAFRAGMVGALCNETTRAELEATYLATAWE